MGFRTGEIIKNRGHTYFQCTCEECGSSKQIRKDRLNTAKCNTIKHHYPSLINNLLDVGDAEKYSYKSHKKTDWICQCCGYIFQRSICDVTNRGFSCPICNNGISFPNRFMAEVLKALNISFECEVVFDWSNYKRYDFYIYPYTIIEVNGMHHYEDVSEFKSKAIDIQNNDRYKQKMALTNGIKNYITIDARYSTDDWLTENILKEMSALYDLSKVDWLTISNNASKNITNQCLESWGLNKDIISIANTLNVSVDFVRDKLKFLTSINKCDYNPLDNWREWQRTLSESNKKRVICVTTNITFDSINDAAEFYNISPKAISNCLNGRSMSAGRLNKQKLFWKFKEEN